MFVDEAKIYVKAGDGGRGCVSFAHYKHNPKGGPDGGDGGKGGSVIIEARRNVSTLLDLRYHSQNLARRGLHGKGSDMSGADGDDLILPVPMGTVVKDAETGEILADLVEEGQRAVAARGGRGGRGNTRFKSSTNQAPRTAEDGGVGEERWLHLELKLMAEVGLVGCPNAGKSTLLSRISSAHPKIGDYPFTTLHPTVGVVKAGDFETFVAADIPGLIKNAHLGKGLGIRFLRHIERTALLLHLVDISQEAGGDPVQRFREINEELDSFSAALGEKEQIVAATKMDLPGAEGEFRKFKEFMDREGIQVYPVSAVTGAGVERLVYAINDSLKTLRETNVGT
jgi:GTP-binding protein